ncbi:uncharacterized protein [Rutidosis leptorrhynchoides]|uniref:uncharacterized protein n=1 Tax=Rutidosis leptorrhynchoides TaxID=125765 RepID=UPI003A9A0871
MGDPARGQSMEALMKTMRAGNGHAIRQPAVNTDFEIAQVEDTIIYLRVFPWSLKDDAKDWLESLPEGDIDSWTTMEDKFLLHFFPASKAAQLQSDINHFTQKPHETLYDAWTQFEMHAMKVGCELCQGPHLKKDCNQASMEEQGPSLEELLQGFIIKTDESITALRQYSESTRQQVRSQQASIQNLEWDVGRIAQSLMERPPGALPSNTQANPNVNGPPRTILTNNNRSDAKNKEPQVPTYSHVNAIFGDEGYDSNEVIPTYTHNGVDGWIRVSDITPAYGDYLMSLMTRRSSSSDHQESVVNSVVTTESPEFRVDEIKVEEDVKPSPKLKVYKPPIPYPRAIQSEQPKETICMPNYGKFLKDLMAKKGEHEQASSIFLEAECAAILEKSDMPPKLGDPGPFIVPCLDELKSTNTRVRLINQSISKPIGIAENLVIKIGELEFPADFVVVDMSEDKVVPIVLGRPFLATAGALTDWRTCKLILRDRGKTLSFQTKFSVKPPPIPIDSVNGLTSETNNVKTETSKKPKCGGEVVKEKPEVKPPDDSVVDRSMRRLFGRVPNIRASVERKVESSARLVNKLAHVKFVYCVLQCDDNRGMAVSAEPSVTPFRDYIALHPVPKWFWCFAYSLA